jgi:Secretion system C-terminal sorting domain
MKKNFILLIASVVLKHGSIAQFPPNYPPSTPAPGNITAIEYFINSKPEFGSGTAITGFTPSANITSYNTNVAIGVPAGLHRFYIRSKDANDKWSHTNNNFFDNYSVPLYVTPPAPSNITAIEYFINSKPEFGSGTAITGFAPSADISGYNSNVAIGVPSGLHRFYLRTKDANGKWSHTNTTLFDNYNVPLYGSAAAVVNVVQMEYFLDGLDLGFGNCTQIPVTPNTNIVGLNANVNVTGLVQGVHRLNIRSKDLNGKWSLTNFSVFDNTAVPNYPAPLGAAPAIANMEYYIDTDPGFGNATPIVVPGNTGDVNNYSINLSLSGSLSTGTHYLYIRSKQNPWSLTTVVPFDATIPLPVSWLYVKGQLQANNTALISWGTASESNTKHYEIEHSTDGVVFSKLGTVNAAGNSNAPLHYSFAHSNMPTGMNYYRVKQIDRDGVYKYSAVITLLNRNGHMNTLIMPNPVENMLTIVEPEMVYTTSLEIFDAKGALVFTKSIRNRQQVISLPVNQLLSGHYILRINYGQNSRSLQLIKK